MLDLNRHQANRQQCYEEDVGDLMPNPMPESMPNPMPESMPESMPRGAWPGRNSSCRWALLGGGDI